MQRVLEWVGRVGALGRVVHGGLLLAVGVGLLAGLGSGAWRGVGAGADGTLWVVDTRGWPGWARWVVLGGGGAACVAWVMGRRAGWVVVGLAVLAWVAGRDAWVHAALRGAGRIDGPVVSASLLLGVALVVALGLVLAGRARRGEAARRGVGRVCVAAVAWCAAAPLVWMACYGATDYRAAAGGVDAAGGADAVVVLGARVYADGRLSDALRDRMDTACGLVLDGHAPVLVVSGGPGPGGVTEAEAMAAYAERRGVPAGAIVRDEQGVNTAATIGFVAETMPGRRVLLVSHAYHLPRLQLAACRAGVKAYTVPAAESYRLTKMPVYVARESVAWWAYALGLR